MVSFADVTSDKQDARCDKLEEDDWSAEFDRWLTPFLLEFSHKAQRKWAPTYLHGLIAPGERKSVEPMAERVCQGETQQLHHFVATSTWDTAGHECVLLEKAAEIVSGPDAHLIFDDTGIPKKGEHSAGVAHQYCGQLGKNANCQVFVSATLARNDVPVPVALRLYLPKEWADDLERRKKTNIPDKITFRTKWQIALDEIDRVMQSNVVFGDVLAIAEADLDAIFDRPLGAPHWSAAPNQPELEEVLAESSPLLEARRRESERVGVALRLSRLAATLGKIVDERMFMYSLA